jgi:hypothetical protein
MATTYKVRYKNHCIPQEQIASGGKYYLDSDCGRKLSGDASTSATLAATGTLTTGQAVDSSPISSEVIASNKDFVYVKNTGSTDIIIALDDSQLASGEGGSNGNYLILLSGGESFASEISTSAKVFAKTASGTSTIEYFVET